MTSISPFETPFVTTPMLQYTEVMREGGLELPGYRVVIDEVDCYLNSPPDSRLFQYKGIDQLTGRGKFTSIQRGIVNGN